MNELKIVDEKYLVPLKDTVAGTRLLTQAPFTLVPYRSEQLHRCSYCLKEEKLQCCSRCHSANFCGQDCFVSAWIQSHHLLCGSTINLDIQELLLARTAVMVHSMKTLTNKINKEQQLFFDLLNREQQYHISDTEKIKIQKVADLLQSMFTFDQLVTIYRAILFASFPITDPECMQLDPIAIGIYPVTSRYIQHACTPNAAWIYEGNKQVLIAIQDISQDTPITVSFTNLIASKQQRSDSLKKRFGDSFTCHCPRCDGEFAHLDQILGRPDLMSANQMELVFAQQVKDWDGELFELTHEICRMIAPEFYSAMCNKQSCKKKSFTAVLHQQLPSYLASHTRQEDTRRIIDISKKLVGKETPYLSVQAARTAEKLFPVLIKEGKWTEASRCAVYLLMIYRLVYPALYPKLVYYRLMVCRTTWNSLVQMELAQFSERHKEKVTEKCVSLYIEIAKMAISKIFGKNSSMWREVVEIQWLFERNQKLK